INGSTIILLSKFKPDEVIRYLPESTVYMGVPTNYVRLLANPGFNQQACKNMRLFTSGSAPLLVQTFDEFQNRTSHTIVERYGMTETGMNTSNPIDGERKPGAVGKPLAGVEVRILDDDDNPVTDASPGNLQVRGKNVFKGYWRLPEKTAEEFTEDGFFRTGDIASLDQDGYIAIMGRDKDLIISGGLNIYPKEIEAVIDKIPGVLESAVIGLPHPDFGEAVTAIVVAEENRKDLTESSIISQLKSQIAGFKVAKQVHFVNELPRNTMGKVQKNILREKLNPQ
ncbi:MAG TPA: AMP-binding protein, partial [Pseudomonadales bacterium]|nr:AMP-binding protein [Pseudomonadales bacterium]